MTQEKKSIQELRKELNEYYKYKYKYILHVKTSTHYVITGVGFRESDMSIEFRYIKENEPDVEFFRPISELTDGRFKL